MPLERKRASRALKLLADETETEAGTFEGYGSVFGNVDSYGDVVEKGAFKKSLRTWKKEHGRFPPMLLQHGGMFGPADDGIPIGVWDDMYEDDTGLCCKGRLFALDTDKGKYIHAGLKSGVLDGLSIGYCAIGVTFGKKPEEPRRKLTEVELFEVSVVTYPANSAARVSAAKSIDDFTSLSDAESYLRDVGFSQRQALAYVSTVARLAKSLRPSDSEGQIAAAKNMSRLLQSITRR
jgi:uncharacterized protein